MPAGAERNRKPRLKTFLSEEKAKEYAQSQGYKNFKVVKSRFGLSKKFKIVLE